MSGLTMATERALDYGFTSRYNHTGDRTMDLLASNLNFTSDELWWLFTNPVSLHVHLSGWGGSGLDIAALPSLLPCTLWAVFFLVLQMVVQKRLCRLGLYLGVVVPKERKASDAADPLTKAQHMRLQKFQNQLWLFAFYTLSSAFGYAVQRDEPWFGLPLTRENDIHLLAPHPYYPGPALLQYYTCGMGFYISEMVTLLCFHQHLRRSDYMEYALHHVVTIALFVFTHCTYYHRMGSYVLFIHDVSDIMLAFTKTLHYVVEAGDRQQEKSTALEKNGKTCKRRVSRLYALFVNETVVHIGFAIFVVLFFFLRFICLPRMTIATIFISVKMLPCTVAHWILALLLHVILQGLHVYWGYLILKLLVRTISGTAISDIRSDDDEDVVDAGSAQDGECATRLKED